MSKTLLVCLLFLFATTDGYKKGHRETCTGNFQPLRNNQRFVSQKSDGSNYNCLCVGHRCQSMTCSRQSEASTKSPLVVRPPTVGLLSTSINRRQASCYDRRTARSYRQNQWFTQNRQGKRYTCQCKITSFKTSIACHFAGFAAASQIPHVPVQPMVSGCYDQVTRRQYREGEAFIRRVGTTSFRQCFCVFEADGVPIIECDANVTVES